MVRDSQDPVGPVIVYSSDSWSTFAGEARLGRFDSRNIQVLFAGCSHNRFSA
jgi:Domain of unknown function (DUF397)